jgi:hypothetical protein
MSSIYPQLDKASWKMTYGVKWRMSCLESQRRRVAGFSEREGTVTTAWKLGPSIFRLKFWDLTCCSDWNVRLPKRIRTNDALSDRLPALEE